MGLGGLHLLGCPCLVTAWLLLKILLYVFIYSRHACFDFHILEVLLHCPSIVNVHALIFPHFVERVLLQCPRLESVHASGCRDKLIGAIQNQVRVI